MKSYKVKISKSANQDIDNLVEFLFTKLSRESSYHYIDIMIQEANSLSLFADCFALSRSKVIRAIHPEARRMVSHNHKWNYIFHVEGNMVVVDRILPSKMIKS